MVRADEPVDPLQSWPAFAERVRERLDAGRLAYGDQSFSRPPGELIEEIKQELLDVCAWSFILFERIGNLEERLQVLESRQQVDASLGGHSPYSWEAMFHHASRRVDELRDQLAKQMSLRVAAEQRAGQRNVVALEARLAELEGRTS